MAISEERQDALDRKANAIMAVVLPLLEAAATGFATYVVIFLVCINYLITPDRSVREYDIRPRRATGIALVAVYCLLLLLFVITFLRLLQVIWTNPGVTPLGDHSVEKVAVSTKHFDRLDAYVCDYQGWPLWCDKCHNWKPHRTHHSKQLGRCIRRMDHYCPYAGGIISETNHKFFVQFLLYASLYTGFTMVVLACFLAERMRLTPSKPSSWIVALALASLFFLFTFGMFLTTFYNVSTNQTTIEIMQRDMVHNIALRGTAPAPSTAPLDNSIVIGEVQRSHSRTFIIVQTQPRTNLWDAGPLANIKAIMGESVVDWFLPLKMSPCTQRSNGAIEDRWGRRVLCLMDDYHAGVAYRGSRRSRRSSRAQTNENPRGL